MKKTVMSDSKLKKVKELDRKTKSDMLKTGTSTFTTTEYKRTVSESRTYTELRTTTTSQTRKISLPTTFENARSTFQPQTTSLSSVRTLEPIAATTSWRSLETSGTSGYVSPYLSSSRSSYQDRLLRKDAVPTNRPVYNSPVSRQLQGTTNQSVVANVSKPITSITKSKTNTSTNSSEYLMTNKHRGVVLIFNQKEFDNNNINRQGSDEDVSKIKKVLPKLGFKMNDIHLYNSLRCKEIEDKIKKWSDYKYDNYDCLMVFFMSHGSNNNVLYARDNELRVHDLYTPFLDKCKSLIGKPKLFFIQACRGGYADYGSVQLKPVVPDSQPMFRIPHHADLLIVQSTVEGYLSYRVATEGSWFLQALCEELDKSQLTGSKRIHLMDILTNVNQSVAYYKEGNNREKQIPTITSHLTKNLYFR